MIIPYILFVVLFSSYDGSPTQFSQEFNSVEACKSASVELLKQANTDRLMPDKIIFCAKK